MQVVAYATGYSVRELSIETGGYSELFVVPFSKTNPPYSKLNACGINPDDSIIYCIMKVDGTSFIIRMDSAKVEFVAKLNVTDGLYAGATFGQSGNFYYLTSSSPHTLYTAQGLARAQGFDNQGAGGLTDLSSAPGSVYTGYGAWTDAVAITADLDKSGSDAEYVLTFTGSKLQVIKASGNEAQYDSWVLPASSQYKEGWGAGWSYNGSVYFANNDGLGVYEIPLAAIDLGTKANIDVKHVAASDKLTKNDGMNCMRAPNPWTSSCRTLGNYHEVPTTKYGTCPKNSEDLDKNTPTTTPKPL